MSATAFDTCAAAKTLREAGFDERQAEAAVAVMRDATAADRNELATKADLRIEIAALETRMTVRFVGIAVGIVLANAGLTFALLKLLP